MEKFIVLDTETTNTLEDAFCYDIGFIVTDGQTIFEKHSYTIADIFLDNDLMENAFFKDKMPKYWEDIKNGDRLLRKFKTVKFIFADICKQYNIKKVYAFNCRFDYNALQTTQRFLTSSKYRYFFPYGIEFHDIMVTAKQTLKNNDEYRRFCLENNFVYGKGKQNRYTAEIVYKFLVDKNFEEMHMGLQDSEIEFEILEKCKAIGGEGDNLLFK